MIRPQGVHTRLRLDPVRDGYIVAAARLRELPRAWYPLIALAAGAILAVTYGPAWSPIDDRQVLQTASEQDVASLFWPYSGYFIVVQRAVAMVELSNPVLIGAIGSYLALVGVALFVEWRIHPALIVALLLAPAFGVYGSLSNISWILAVYLVAMLVATPATSARGRLGDAAGLLACGLTGPFSLFFLPLYVVRARDPRWRMHLLAVAVASACQVVALAMSLALSLVGNRPAHDVLAVFAERAALPLALVAFCSLWLPARRVAGALYVAALIPLLGIMTTFHTTAELMAGAGQRYFYLPWVVAIGMLAFVALARLRFTARTSR